ncbi:beta-lactamase family protein [Streptomonospora sp. S1-112]|uniref:Beta-lactamase family protein n=1 Tax=Streptomonospora mangrovi TaxID=2883123 RepID=A0A9X3NJQ5_9ACTN|nr:serine hydrolase domain-containing protein [Streptomonospora mangrovi]MDA0565012.1 beta-lactamase family protein [Streptomonospora mangrovi]
MPTPRSLPLRRAFTTARAGRLVAAAFAAVLTAASIAPGAAAADPGGGAEGAGATPAAIDALVREYRAALDVPGVAVTVTRGRETVHAAGYGTTPSGAAVTADTPMAVASVSKSFTATAVLQLVEAGEVDLDRPVAAYLPEFTMADPRAADITVRQLLDQTSGMSDTTFPAFTREQPDTLREAVAGMRTGRLAAAPGERYEYHNPNFQVAARLVEVVADRPFAEQLRAGVFAPLGMDRSTTLNTDRDLPPSAHGHLRVAGQAVALPEPCAFGAGSGGVVSTASDMAAWLIAQNSGGRGPGGARILSPESTALAHTPSPDSGSYALGWSTGETPSGAPVIEHSGDLFTSTAYQALLPESGHGVAVMANTGMAHGDAQAIGAALVALIEEGRAPAAPAQTALVWLDAGFLALALAAAAAGWRGARRAGRWARARAARPVWAVLRLLPLALPPLLLAEVHRVVGFLYRGRDVAWIQVAYLYPAFLVLLAVAALACAVVAAMRVAHLVRERRRRP